MGNALMARLLRSALDAGVELWDRAAVVDLLKDGNRITGAVIERNGERIEVTANRGVVLASGGFSANPEMRAKFIPYPDQHVSLVPETNTGDGLNMAMSAGGVMEEENLCNGAWTLMSLATHPDGTVTKFPHLFLDRPKPGCIAVNSRGERFADEAALDMVKDMHASGSVPAHLVCDHKFIKKYGLGMVKPGGMGLKKWINQGYIVTAPTLAELAGKIGVDAAGLEESARRMTRYASDGHDPDFGKGNPKDVGMGDPDHKPNPCLGPVETGPFYAVKVYPGDSTTTLGLRVDDRARVMDTAGQPLKGLYAAGLDMNSLWRGVPPGNGGNNTLSLTFGYIAALDMAQGEAHDKVA
jgi:succinate dehydrogenase/fumarate reductase flavoprotein subunit